MNSSDQEKLLDEAAKLVRSAQALVITAGAGMGVDSGLPDFRGNEGFWKAYPPYQHLKLSFSDLANPRWFSSDPAFAWGFYGHRLMLYRQTSPHAGFGVLKRMAARMSAGHFVFTSNVDGQFQRAGFDASRVVECHGSIHDLQCIRNCGQGIFSADSVQVEVDQVSFHAKEPFPTCPSCKGLARPNILMFGDWGWDSSQTDEQQLRIGGWLRHLPTDCRLVVIECGAGSAIPTVRHFSEHIAETEGRSLIRINVREPEVWLGHIGISMGAKAALEEIEKRI